MAHIQCGCIKGFRNQMPGSFSGRIYERLDRVEKERQEAEDLRKEKFSGTRNLYRDLRRSGKNDPLEVFKRKNRRNLFLSAGFFLAIFLNIFTGMPAIVCAAVCVPTCLVLAYYNERQREAAKKRPILRNYD
jgi:Flp pilus assembly protein TadB